MKSVNYVLLMAVAAGGCLADDEFEPGEGPVHMESVQAEDGQDLDEALNDFVNSAPTEGSSFRYTGMVETEDGRLVEDVITVEYLDTEDLEPVLYPQDDLAEPNIKLYLEEEGGTRTVSCLRQSPYRRAERAALASSCNGFPDYRAMDNAESFAVQALARDSVCTGISTASSSAICATIGATVVSSSGIPAVDLLGETALPLPNENVDVCAREKGANVVRHLRGTRNSCSNWLGQRWNRFFTRAQGKAVCGARCVF